MRAFLAVAAIVSIGMTSAPPAHAQGVQTGTIRGTVRDPQGLVVPGAIVTVLSPALQGQRSTVTSDEGLFTLQFLPPGDYQVVYEKGGFEVLTQDVAVPLGGVVEHDVVLRVQGVGLSVTVVAPIPSPLATPAAGLNVRQGEVEALAAPRDLAGIAQLAPAVSENAPNDGQLVVNGGFAFDNSFLVNGVDVNDNVFGIPQPLFIEDAIQETQTLTSGIPSEYGHFSGGVVNAITRSGGNSFSGSLRLNLTNPSWTVETPFERTRGIERPDDLNQTWEGTFGGPVVLNRLWFFAAGRFAETAIAGSLPQTNAPNTTVDTNRRGEIKVTGTIASTRTLQFAYANNHRKQESLAALPFTIDPATLRDRVDPNWYLVGNYRGTHGLRTLAEGQVSERRFELRPGGEAATALVDSPFQTATLQLAHYNGPFFDPSDPESRNTRQVTGSVTHFLDRIGRHEIKGGYEWLRNRRVGGNSPSATDVLFVADYVTDAAGAPVLDAARRLMPRFVPGGTLLIRALSQRGGTLDIDTSSLFIQDRWALNSRIALDVGTRVERVTSVAYPPEVEGVRTTTIVPRLAGSLDVRGDGSHVVHATYGWYAGRYVPRFIGANTNVGNPDAVINVYLGPPGQGRGFAPGFDPANYLTVAGQFPSTGASLDPDLRSPVVREWTMAYGVTLGEGGGYAQATYVHRRTVDMIEDLITRDTGVVQVVRDGAMLGTFSRSVWTNTDLARRVYDGLELQGRSPITPRWTVTGHYTLQLRNDGNYEGEGPNQPGLTSRIGDYPEAFTEARAFPDGRLQSFQRHRLRMWTIYDVAAGARGDLTVSALWRVDSGGVYSLVALNQPLTGVQRGNLAGYPAPPPNQSVFFGERGSQTFPGYGAVDVSLNYGVPVLDALRPYVKLDIFNLLNNQKVIGFNTTVLPDPASPTDALGLPTSYLEAPGFGRADSTQDFPTPYSGLTGGRSFRVAVGFRF
jgi:hypothetical protein